MITIVLPTYNRADLLPRAINSVIDQTYPNWELIIWDDGSTDSTAEILSTFQDERIKYYFDENHGAAYARNRALEKARGKYIAFLDSDDTWTPEKLALQFSTLEKFPQIDLLFSDFQNNNLARDKKGTGFVQNEHAMATLVTSKLEDDLFLITDGMPQALAIGNFTATDSVLLRADVLSRVGTFNDQLRNSEDFELWWRMGLAGVQFTYLDEVLMTRYKPVDSLSSPGVESGLNTIKALDICKENSLAMGHTNHLTFLNRSYRNTWQNLITAYGQQKNLPMAFHAFRKSLTYGFRPGSVRLLIQAFFGTLVSDLNDN